MTQAEYKRLSQRYLAIVEAHLARIEEAGSAVYPKLNEAMFYSVKAGGKRLRPCLTLAVCDMFGGDMDTALPIACALEMIHTYSLIHDDLPCMDDDDMRRGRPSNHKVFGEAMAVLAGDGLLSLAHETMINGLLRLPDNNRLGYIKAMHTVAELSGAAGMVSGQAADIEAEGKTDISPELLSYIHLHKTADMLKAAVLSGAQAAGAGENECALIEEYGANLGLLFQITDDILDVKGDSAVVGKTLGKDSEEGKLTYVSMYGLDGAVKAADAAARAAKLAVAGLDDNGYLNAVIDNILVRSF